MWPRGIFITALESGEATAGDAVSRAPAAAASPCDDALRAWVAAPNGACYFADARILHEGYEAAAAKVLEEAARADAGVATCSDVLPLLPVQVAAPAASGGTSRPPAALTAARVLAPQSKTVVLEAAEALPRAVS
jgi:hypothetical protein